MKVNLLDMYTPHELGIMTYKDIAAKREKRKIKKYTLILSLEILDVEKDGA